MGTRVTMSKEGMDELKIRVARNAIRPVTHAVAMDMHLNVPVDTGDLQGTISEDYSLSGRGRVFFGDVDSGVDYHLYVEFGTSKAEAQPFARPALYKARTL